MKPVILCIDDEEIVLSSLKTALKNIFGEKFSIETAENGQYSMELFDELTAHEVDIPLVIVDYIMPDMKGDMLLKYFHSKSPETLKILLTGQATLEGVTNAINTANLYRYISKPWEPKDFDLTISEAVRCFEQNRQLRMKKAELLHMNQVLEQKVVERTKEIFHQKQEIEARKEQLQFIVSELEKLSVVASETDNAITIMDAEGNIEWINKSYVKIYGYELDDLIRTKGTNLLQVSSNPKIKEIMADCLEHKTVKVYNTFCLNRYEKKVWFQTTLTPILDENKNIKKLIAVDSDVTKIKEAELQVMEKNRELEKLSIIASKTRNAIMITDARGDVEWVNEGFTRIYGFNLMQLTLFKGNNILKISPNPNLDEIITRGIIPYETIIYENLITTKFGNKVWVQTTLTPLFDSEKRLSKLIILDSDITNLKLAEERIIQQKIEIEAHRDLIAQINLDITDSIRYAKRIQSAFLPDPDYISGIFPEHFILYKPRDIISGDFYMITRKGKRVFIIAADCTGHGVPGAFMSMLGTALINEILNNIYGKITAAEILNLLRENIIKSLHQSGKFGESKDGMDISLCILDENHKKIQFSGANNPLYIVSKSKVESEKSAENKLQGINFGLSDFQLYELKGDKMPIAIHDKMDDFTNHEIHVNKGDIIYLFSDGFADQFGGPRCKKYLYKQFKELLLKICHKPMQAQKEDLANEFKTWKGGNHQVDDVLVIGCRIS